MIGDYGRVTQADSAHRTVLVVEDEFLIRFVAAETRRDAGFEVLKAGDAQEALTVVASRSDIAMLFTDINMPGPVDGVELARRVQDERPDIRLTLTLGKVRPLPDETAEGAFLTKPLFASGYDPGRERPAWGVHLRPQKPCSLA